MCELCNQSPKPAPSGLTSRRELLLLSLAVMLAGCGTDPTPKGAATASTRPAGCPDLGAEIFPDATGQALVNPDSAPVDIEARSEWTTAPLDLTRIVPMGVINRATIHHSGLNKPFTADSWKETTKQLDAIREFHTASNQRNWADIAYHFLIDRAGRIWQGRPLAYQGAHVKNHNEHNCGIVLLGNFDLQRPSAVQLTHLELFLGYMRSLYHFGAEDIYMHGELADAGTDCPGQYLKTWVKTKRATW